jgi:hypothetical protein
MLTFTVIIYNDLGIINFIIESIMYNEIISDLLPGSKKYEEDVYDDVFKVKPKRRNRSKSDEYYVDPVEFSEELRKYHKELEMCDVEYIEPSNKLGQMILDIVNNYASKPCWSNYPLLDDMKGDAILRIMQYLPRIKPDNNPFSYCTCTCFSAFIANINNMKRNLRKKGELAYDHFLDLEREGIDMENRRIILDDIQEALGY